MDPKQFASTEWLCRPKDREIQVLDDSWTTGNAIHTSIGLDYCHNMKNHIADFDDSDCAVDSTPTGTYNKI